VTQPLCDQLGAFPIVASIEDAQVLRIGAQIDTGRPRADFRVGLRPRCEVSGLKRREFIMRLPGGGDS